MYTMSILTIVQYDNKINLDFFVRAKVYLAYKSSNTTTS